MNFKNKYKAPIIVGISALLMGVISFFVTVKIYDDNYSEKLNNRYSNKIIKNYSGENNTIIAKINNEAIKEDIKITNEVISKGGENTKEEYFEEIDVPEISEEEYNEIVDVLAKNEDETANEIVIETTANIQKNSGETKKDIEKKLEFINPISGEIGLSYATEKLIYSNTLEEWITHNGIDILGEEAEPIKAIEDGIVESVKMDPRYGNTIIIKHNDEYKSIYSNLSTTDLVFVGKKITKGEIISGIGKGFGFESKEEPHVHLTILKNGESINPVDVIKVTN